MPQARSHSAETTSPTPRAPAYGTSTVCPPPVERLMQNWHDPGTDTSHLSHYRACARAPGGWGFGMVATKRTTGFA